MNSEHDILAIQNTAIFLKREGAKINLPRPSRIIYSGNRADIESDINSLGVVGSDDPDGTVLTFSAISKSYNVIFLKWIGQEFTAANCTKDTVFFDLNGDYAVQLSSKVVSYSNDNFRNTIENVIAYNLLIWTLSEDKVSDHHNIAGKQFVFYSSTKGVIKITYQSPAPLDSVKIELPTIHSLIGSIKSLAHKIHFINGLFKVANEKPIVPLATVISNADLLDAIIKRDYEIAIKQFDFDKFKDNLLKEKDKYFNSIREIVNKVFGQLIGIPVSISASAFATYKVENESSTLFLILLGFTFYVFLYIKIQMSYLADLGDIQTDFDRDFKEIKLKSGLDGKVIQTESDKIEKKIKKTTSMIRVMIFGISILGGTFTLYLLNQLYINFNGVGLIHSISRLLLCR